MFLYHGTNIYFEQIDLTLCNQYKDFGKAFYLSDNVQQARDVAASRVDFFGGEPIILTFEFDEFRLNDGSLQVKIFHDGYTEEWADFIYAHRDETVYPPHQHPFDYVYGPIANDRVGAQIRKFRNGDIDKAQFLLKLRYMRGITFQHAFCTPKALQCLTFKGQAE